MRILTSEWRDLKTMESMYDLWYCRVDPRASSIDEDFLQECLGPLYHDVLCDMAMSLPTDHVPVLPTRDDVMKDVYRSLETLVEEKRGRLPSDMSHLVADIRLFALGVVSPGLMTACTERRDMYAERADAIYGRWLWHTLDDIPLLGEDAVRLADSIRFSSFAIDVFGDDLVLSNDSVSITLHDAVYDHGAMGDGLDVRQCELYHEDGTWELHLLSSTDEESEVSFTSFDIEEVLMV